jgi:hypothetical protein
VGISTWMFSVNPKPREPHAFGPVGHPPSECDPCLMCGVKCCGLVLRVLAFTGQRTVLWGSWLTCKPRPVHKVGFIREKGKATGRAVQQCPETSGFLFRWRLRLFMDTLTLG